jgi:hypothetical protein
MTERGALELAGADPTLVELLRQKTDESATLLGHYIRSYTVYLAVTGALVKFAFDANSTPQLRRAMIILGFLISAAGLLVCVFGESVRRTLAADLRMLRQRAGLPELASDLLAIKYTVITGVVFIIIATLGWLFLLVAAPTISAN